MSLLRIPLQSLEIRPGLLTHAAEDASLLRDQIVWIAELDHRALVQDENLVVVDDGLQTMRDGDGCVLDLADRLLDLGVGGVVDGCRSFVHEEDFGVLEHGAGEAEELALALGEVRAGFSNMGVEVAENVFVL